MTNMQWTGADTWYASSFEVPVTEMRVWPCIDAQLTCDASSASAQSRIMHILRVALPQPLRRHA